MNLNTKINELCLFELNETQARIEYLTKIRVDPIYMSDLKSDIDKELKELFDRYLLLYAYYKLYSESSDEDKLERYLVEDVEDKLLEKILHLDVQDKKAEQLEKEVEDEKYEKKETFNDVFFRLIKNGPVIDSKINQNLQNVDTKKSAFVETQLMDNPQSKTDSGEVLQNRTFNKYPDIDILNKKHEDLLKQQLEPDNNLKQESNKNNLSLNSSNTVASINNENQTNNLTAVVENPKTSNPIIEANSQTTINNPLKVNLPRNDLQSNIYLVPIVGGIALLVGGIFLYSSNFLLPPIHADTLGVIIKYLSIYPGFFIPLSALTGLGSAALGFSLGYIGCVVLLLGIGIWKNVRFSSAIGALVFFISTLFTLTSLITNGLAGAPYALVALGVNGVTSYLLYLRARATNP